MAPTRWCRFLPPTSPAVRSARLPGSHRPSGRWSPRTWVSGSRRCSTAATTASQSRCRCAAMRRPGYCPGTGCAGDPAGDRRRDVDRPLGQPGDLRPAAARPAPGGFGRQAGPAVERVRGPDRPEPDHLHRAARRGVVRPGEPVPQRQDPQRGDEPARVPADPRFVRGNTQEQNQIATFLASAGTRTINPDPAGPASVFEVPINNPNELRTLNFVRPLVP